MWNAMQLVNVEFIIKFEYTQQQRGEVIMRSLALGFNKKSIFYTTRYWNSIILSSTSISTLSPLIYNTQL